MANQRRNDLVRQLDKSKTDFKAISDGNQSLRAEVSNASTNELALRTEIAKLKAEVTSQKQQTNDLQRENEEIKTLNSAELQREQALTRERDLVVIQLKTSQAELKQTNEKLAAVYAELSERKPVPAASAAAAAQKSNIDIDLDELCSDVNRKTGTKLEKYVCQPYFAEIDNRNLAIQTAQKEAQNPAGGGRSPTQGASARTTQGARTAGSSKTRFRPNFASRLSWN